MNITIILTETDNPSLLTAVFAAITGNVAIAGVEEKAIPTKLAKVKAIEPEVPQNQKSVVEPSSPAAEIGVTGGEKITVEQVRELVAEKTKIDGKKALVKTLLTSFNAPNITSLDSKDYAAFLEKLKAL